MVEETGLFPSCPLVSGTREIMIPFENLKSEFLALQSNAIRYIFSLSSNIFFRKQSLTTIYTYIYIYTRLDSTAFIFGFLPPKIRLFCRLVSLSSCGGGVIGSNRNVNPATDPAAPLISGDKEAGRKIGREGGGGYARDGRE